eukprot:481669_1
MGDIPWHWRIQPSLHPPHRLNPFDPYCLQRTIPNPQHILWLPETFEGVTHRPQDNLLLLIAVNIPYSFAPLDQALHLNCIRCRHPTTMVSIRGDFLNKSSLLSSSDDDDDSQTITDD